MNKYFQFLCSIVGAKQSPKRSHDYDLLLTHLHRIEFYSLVPNDDNRGEDGKKLREIFLDEQLNRGSRMGSSSLRLSRDEEHQLRDMLPEGPCTVLEMLIGLSIRMDNELGDSSSNRYVAKSFWILIRNLDLNWCSNQEYLGEAIDDKVRVFLDRTYDRKGVGGLFPLEKSRKDQRRIEIWYQMAEYLLEHYEF